MLAATVAAQTSNLTRPMPEPVAEALVTAPDLNMPLLQNAPKTGRAVNQVQMMERGEAVVGKGSQLDMVVNAKEYYTKPSSAYGVSLHSTPVSLGSFTSDASGNLNMSVVIPADTEPGFHTVHIFGKDVFEQPIDLQQVVYVAGSAEDYDSDGVANDADSCVLVAQSGIDIDVDGVDDGCDAVIGDAPVSPPEPEGIIWRDDTVLTIEIQGVSGQ